MAVVVLGLAAPFAFFAMQKHQRGVLWHVVQLCLADQIENGRPRPCAYVDISSGTRRGYAVLDDPFSRAQFLLMPTRRLAGIESPELLTDDAPNYWQDAWAARTFVFHRLRRSLSREDVGLAVNSAYDRSQDQLHIHIACLQPVVRRQIDAHADTIGSTWKHLDFDLEGRRYWARRIEASDLHGINPFRLLSDLVTMNGSVMWRETLVVAGVTFTNHRDGFVLLADTADPPHGDLGHGESLLDHSCALVKQ
jgi:CDP-diacylglycerol pyrophosphatase